MSLYLTVLHAIEKGNLKDREKINWKLITNLFLDCKSDAIEKIQLFALRWKIKVFHKILKSGLNAKEKKVSSAERIVKIFSIFSILALWVFRMTLIQSFHPKLPPTVALDNNEVKIIRLLKKKNGKTKIEFLPDFIKEIAILGGYLDHSPDCAPENLNI